MPFVMNTRDEDVHVKVFGKDFMFKPKQIKEFHQDNIAQFLTVDKREEGFIGLPQEAEELEWRQSEDGKAVIAAAMKQGIASYCGKLRQIVYNLEVSMRQDLDRKNIKADPRAFASAGELRAYKELVKYQQSENDVEQNRIDEIKELQKQIKGA